MVWAQLGGAAISGVGSGMAGDSQEDAAHDAKETQQLQQYMAMKNTQPYRKSGKRATGYLDHLLGNTGETMTQSDFEKNRREHYKWKNPMLSSKKLQSKLDRDWQSFQGDLKERKGKDGYGSLMKRFGAEDFEASPGYQFRMEEGAKGMDRSAAARGGLLSGAALKAMERYRQGTASDEFGRAWERDRAQKSDMYNRLSGVANRGLSATSTMLGQTGAAANQISEYQTQMGNAKAAGITGVTNALGGGFAGAMNSLKPPGGGPTVDTNQINLKPWY